jgi:hypothetical protein
MNKPHLHAEVIKAWADGAEIEWCINNDLNEWKDIVGYNPHWHSHINYRVKPKTVVKYHGIMQGTNGYECMNHNTGFHAELSHVRDQGDNWKVIAIAKTTFLDGVPIAVEIVK